MSGCVVWKCTICGNENAAWNCPCAVCGHARKPVTNEAPPTEMTSLREIKDKLDALAESQGKLLAALNDIGGNISTNDSLIMGHLQAIDSRLDALDAGLHETAMRNHQQVRGGISELAGIMLDHFGLRRVAVTRKASKKARKAVGKAR